MIRRLLVALLLGLFGPHIAAAAPDSVVVLAWSDALDPDLLADFRRETGLRVLVDSYAAPDAVPERLRAKTPAYDLALFPLDVLPRAAASLAALDPSAGRLDPSLMRLVAASDTGGVHALPFDWFPTGIASNPAQLKTQGVTLDPQEAWTVLTRPEVLRAAAACGLGVPDRPRLLFAAALKALGRDPAAPNALDVRRALASLTQLRLAARRLPDRDLVEGLADGTLCAAVVSAPDAVQASDRASAGSGSVDLAFAAPAGPLSIDVMAIATQAPNPSGAARLLAFLLRPENAIRAARFGHGAAAVGGPGAVPDTPLFTTPWTAETLFSVPDYNAALLRTIDAEWARGKAR